MRIIPSSSNARFMFQKLKQPSTFAHKRSPLFPPRVDHHDRQPTVSWESPCLVIHVHTPHAHKKGSGRQPSSQTKETSPPPRSLLHTKTPRRANQYYYSNSPACVHATFNAEPHRRRRRNIRPTSNQVPSASWTARRKKGKKCWSHKSLFYRMLKKKLW